MKKILCSLLLCIFVLLSCSSDKSVVVKDSIDDENKQVSKKMEKKQNEGI